MYFIVTTAKASRLDRALTEKSFERITERTIKKGDKCLVFSNGTIGQGARSYNYSKDEAIKMLESLIIELKK